MINEKFVSDWDPVIPIKLMTAAQKDNELERIYERIPSGRRRDTSWRSKINPNREFDRGFKQGITIVITIIEAILTKKHTLDEKKWLDGYDRGYTAGRDEEVKASEILKRLEDIEDK